jgi:hypothetical protein
VGRDCGTYYLNLQVKSYDLAVFKSNGNLATAAAIVLFIISTFLLEGGWKRSYKIPTPNTPMIAHFSLLVILSFDIVGSGRINIIVSSIMSIIEKAAK